jgi:hypothetical protein
MSPYVNYPTTVVTDHFHYIIFLHPSTKGIFKAACSYQRFNPHHDSPPDAPNLANAALALG